jgi:hypothetical protein
MHRIFDLAPPLRHPRGEDIRLKSFQVRLLGEQEHEHR